MTPEMVVVFTVDDVLAAKPNWTEEQALAFIERHGRYFEERLAELGFETILTLAEMDKEGQ